MDPDEQPDPTDTQAQPAPVEDNPGEPSDADPALGDEAGAGPAVTDEHPPAADDYGHRDDLVGDWANPDVDLSHLVPTDDGDPDDEAELIEADE
jgi:hypothetical protein